MFFLLERAQTEQYRQGPTKRKVHRVCLEKLCMFLELKIVPWDHNKSARRERATIAKAKSN